MHCDLLKACRLHERRYRLALRISYLKNKPSAGREPFGCLVHYPSVKHQPVLAAVERRHRLILPYLRYESVNESGIYIRRIGRYNVISALEPLKQVRLNESHRSSVQLRVFLRDGQRSTGNVGRLGIGDITELCDRYRNAAAAGAQIEVPKLLTVAP